MLDWKTNAGWPRGLPRKAALALTMSLLPAAAWATSASETLPNAPDARWEQQSAPPQQPDTSTPANQPQQPPANGQAKPGANGYTLKNAEHQRIFGIIPEFQAVNQTNGKYVPLTVGQKFSLMFKSSTDPYIFTLDAFVAGIGQAKDSNPGYGQGAEGYFKRYGASYADTFDGNFWGNAVLTSALREDPRYFRKGPDFGFTHRALYSASTAVWCKRDAGTWGPNYANVLGNLIGGGISNAYYPAADRGVGKTLSGAATVTAEGIIGSELEEFWPDISGHFVRKRQQKQMEKAGARPE